MIMPGILLCIGGILIIILGKSESHQEYIRKHNFEETEEIMQDIRKIGGIVFIILGVGAIILGILN